MRKIEDVLRLHAQGMSTRRIALATGVGKTTVIEYLRRAAVAGLSWPLPEGLDEEALERRVFPPPPPSQDRQFAAADWAMVHRELKRPGVTLALLWDEYRGQHPDGYGYSAFCEHYRRWVGRLSPVMRQRHVAGERMFVDYSGTRMTVIDPVTGAARPAEIFIAVMGASNMTYAEATWSQALPDWIGAHTRAFAAFGAVPALVVSDNLKSGVIRACFYEPEINRSYAEMAAHYGTAILPARPYKPRDKEQTSRCTLLEWLSDNEFGLAATIATADAFFESDVAWRFVQVSMIGGVSKALENALSPELVNGRNAHAELLGYFLPGEHATLAQPFIPALQSIGAAHEHDLLQREGFAAPVAMPEFVETSGDLPVVGGLQKLVNQRHDLCRRLAYH